MRRTVVRLNNIKPEGRRCGGCLRRSAAILLKRGVFVQHVVVETAERGIGIDDGHGGAELRVKIVERDAVDRVGRADGCAEGGGVRDGNGLDLRLEP